MDSVEFVQQQLQESIVSIRVAESELQLMRERHWKLIHKFLDLKSASAQSELQAEPQGRTSDVVEQDEVNATTQVISAEIHEIPATWKSRTFPNTSVPDNTSDDPAANDQEVSSAAPEPETPLQALENDNSPKILLHRFDESPPGVDSHVTPSEKPNFTMPSAPAVDEQLNNIEVESVDYEIELIMQESESEKTINPPVRRQPKRACSRMKGSASLYGNIELSSERKKWRLLASNPEILPTIKTIVCNECKEETFQGQNRWSCYSGCGQKFVSPNCHPSGSVLYFCENC